MLGGTLQNSKLLRSVIVSCYLEKMGILKILVIFFENQEKIHGGTNGTWTHAFEITPFFITPFCKAASSALDTGLADAFYSLHTTGKTIK